jgi:hypothetical protein
MLKNKINTLMTRVKINMIEGALYRVHEVL